MKTRIAVLFTVGLIFGCGLILVLTGISLFGLMVIGTSVWAAVDSEKHRLRKYQSGISYGPVALRILCAIFWIVGFPW